jgi:hypothetical protein
VAGGRKERVAALEAVHDAGSDQGIDGPVDGNRRQPLAAPGHAVQHLVGPDRPVTGSGDLLEHRLAQGGQPKSLVLECLARARHRVVEAQVVVVPGRRWLYWGSQVHAERYNTSPPAQTPPPGRGAAFWRRAPKERPGLPPL